MSVHLCTNGQSILQVLCLEKIRDIQIDCSYKIAGPTKNWLNWLKGQFKMCIMPWSDDMPVLFNCYCTLKKKNQESLSLFACTLYMTDVQIEDLGDPRKLDRQQRSNVYNQACIFQQEGKIDKALKYFLAAITGLTENNSFHDLPHCLHQVSWLLKGTSHDFLFQISLFSLLADIFAYLEIASIY